MKHISRVFTILWFVAAVFAAPAPAHRTGSWATADLGNHRVVIAVAAAGVNRVTIPWRRPDADPQRKGFILHDSAGRSVTEAWLLEANRERGELVFHAAQAGTFHLYHMACRIGGRTNYPQTEYLPAPTPAAAEWLKVRGLGGLRAGDSRWRRLPEARVEAIEAASEFDSFQPMEVIATAAEVRGLLTRHPRAAYLLFGEDRAHPIKMRGDLPQRWIERGAGVPLELSAERNEFLAFQVGLYAARREVRQVEVDFSDLRGAAGEVIPAAALRCFNTGGVDWSGRAFAVRPGVPLGRVQALWCGIDVPAGVRPGLYEGTVSVRPGNAPAMSLPLRLTIGAGHLPDRGDSDPARLSRLRWLDSRLADDDDVVKPFTPLRVEERTIHCLGRRLTVAACGLPQQIESLFTPAMTAVGTSPRPLLAAPMAFVAEPAAGRAAEWSFTPLEWPVRTPGRVSWRTRGENGAWAMTVEGSMEFDGCVEYQVTLTALTDGAVRDLRLEVPLLRAAAKYVMGLGLAGGRRPGEHQWRWQVDRNQDAVWLGDVNAGLQCSFKDKNHVRPLNTNFYQSKPLQMPPSWYNEGQGGIFFKDTSAQTTLLTAYSGPRRLQKGDTMHFDFRLLITPFKPLDTAGQWRRRYYHKYEDLGTIAAAGANVVNVHHATPINPYINYPFFRPAEMKAYAAAAHARGMAFKIYYTVRELCNRAPELWALRSLGDEVLSRGPGGGFSWLAEHLRDDYIAAWFVPELTDAAVINSGVSRWHNFYVEGLQWLVQNVGIDGIYIDDVAFDRLIMKRVRRVLERGRPEPLIDLHSANQYNYRDGFTNSANLYLEHFPYIDRLWFGEYFNYNAPIDYWLTEVSGIPFGLMGEMLEGGGNPWRGLLFGMTNRLPWAGDPRPVWKLWDDFGMAQSEMLGWWLEDLPIRSGNEQVPLTLYRRPDRVLICLASWAPADVTVKLQIDWARLGLDPQRAVLQAPAVTDMQEAASFRPDAPIPVPAGKGVVLILRLEEKTGKR